MWEGRGGEGREEGGGGGGWGARTTETANQFLFFLGEGGRGKGDPLPSTLQTSLDLRRDLLPLQTRKPTWNLGEVVLLSSRPSRIMRTNFGV